MRLTRNLTYDGHYTSVAVSIHYKAIFLSIHLHFSFWYHVMMIFITPCIGQSYQKDSEDWIKVHETSCMVKNRSEVFFWPRVRYV